MKVAVISDIHGNMHALDAVMEEIRKFAPDHLICAGDITNPFLRSRDVWHRLKGMSVPILRGNHEDYIISYYSGDRPEIRDGVHFGPVQIVARHLGPEIAQEFAALPFDLTLAGPGGDDLYFCHASPQHNARSYIRGVDAEMARSFADRVPASARTVIAGHIHEQWSRDWEDKRLILCGSVGLPHHGKPEPEFALLTHQSGAWSCELRTVPYDVPAALKELRESIVYEQGGPIARLLHEELEQARPRLIHILPRILKLPAEERQTLAQWERLVAAVDPG